MKKLIGMIVLGLLVAGPGALQAAEPKIGYVDLQRALNECDAGKKAREKFVAEMERKQAKLRQEKEALDTKREEFDKKAMVLRDKERLGMEQELEDQSLAFKRKYEDYQKELKRIDDQYTGAILQSLRQVISQLGSEAKYTMIFEVQSSGIIYGATGADLTEEVIRRFNKR